MSEHGSFGMYARSNPYPHLITGVCLMFFVDVCMQKCDPVFTVFLAARGAEKEYKTVVCVSHTGPHFFSLPLHYI